MFSGTLAAQYRPNTGNNLRIAATQATGARYAFVMGKRIKEARKDDMYKGTRLKADIISYGIGCADGEEEARAFYRGLMEQHPNVYGGRLASLLMDAVGLKIDGTVETSYRSGWLVGIAFALECWLHEAARWRHGG